MSERVVLLWEFQVVPGQESAFRALYGPGGAWAMLFRRHPGFLGTELLQDRAHPGRFLTLDRWRSAEDHRAFLDAHAEDYAALDHEGEALTLDERSLGAFQDVPPC